MRECTLDAGCGEQRALARGLIAVDARTRELVELARRVAASDVTVLLTGASGVGKEVFARFIHQSSARRASPFLAVNCAAIPEALLETTLFGHEKGAFTGATHMHAGKFELAHGGTLLLDEISELPLALQAKLLRVLQERELERVGGRVAVALDLRIIATSNRDLDELVSAGRFREDLYYRINVFPLAIPSLAERPADILPLARALLARHAPSHSPRPLALSAEAERQLLKWGWPGNVRELDNVMQRALVLCDGNIIEPAHLGLATEVIELPPAAGNWATQDVKGMERSLILATLAAVKGSRKQAVARLGISERTLRYRLQEYRQQGIDPDAIWGAPQRAVA
jgi:two-component system response regulator FlrC